MNFNTKVDNQVETILIPFEERTDQSNVAALLAALGVNVNKMAEESLDGKKHNVTNWFGSLDGKDIKILMLGLGENAAYADAVAACKKCRKRNVEKWSENVAIYTDGLNAPEPALIEGLANGWTQGKYDIALYKTEEKTMTDPKLTMSGKVFEKEAYKTAANKGVAIAETQTSIMDLVNAPSNKKSPVELANWAVESGNQNGFKVSIIDKKELESLGFHGLLAVNRGSEIPAKCVIMEYEPPRFNKTVAIVGKGVTFDTGGLSIKGSNNMHYMKSDMGGAAATLGTLEAVAKLKLPVKVVGIVPTTDNSVDAAAIKPGDVISSYAGKTIEVINTDAEGRLILADGLAYAEKNFEPDYMIDLATLTGSIIAAIGTEAAGLFTKNEELIERLQAAGKTTGEKLWPMPMWNSYAELMASDIADIRNLGAKPFAGSITAAKFLEFFTNEHPAWAHIDMAGTAFGPNDLGKEYCASGYGVRLLVEFLEQL